MRRLIVVGLLAFAVALTGTAYAEVQNIKVSGDIDLKGVSHQNYDLKAKQRNFSHEGTGGPDNVSNDDDESFFLSTVHVQVDADLTDNVSTSVRLLNQRKWDNHVAGADQISLDTAYVTLKEFLYSPLTIIAGRQDLNYGTGFIVGKGRLADPEGVFPSTATTGSQSTGREYSVHNSFDAIRAILDFAPLTVEGLISKNNETGVLTNDEDLYGFVVMAAIVAVVATASRYIGLFGVWRYVRKDVEPVRIGIRESLRQAFRNDQFLFFLPTFVFFNMAIMLLTAALPFYADVVILGDQETLDVSLFGRSTSLGEGGVSSVLFATTILAVLVALPFIYRLALWRGKAWVYSAAMLVGVFTFPSLFFMGFVPGIHPLVQSLVFVALAGLPMVGVFTFPNAILADIIDYDSVRTGMRREALYYGAQNVIEKWTGSLMFPIFGVLLLLGETVDNPLGIRLMGPVAGVASLVGFLFFRGYRLPDSVTAESVQFLAGPEGSQARQP